MAHFVGGRVLFNECFNASYFFLPILSTLHTQNAIGGVDGRSGWKNMKRKRKCEKKKGERLEELPDQVAPLHTDGGWREVRGRGAGECTTNNIFLKNRNAHLTQLRTNDFDSAWWISGHLCAKLSRLIPAFQNVQNTHFSWLNIFARLPCPF